MMAKDIFLKKTGAVIEPLVDIDMSQFLQHNIRGGISFINTWYADVDEVTKDLGEPVSAVYLDLNNLYGTIMKYYMPMGEYRWMTQEEIDKFDFTTIRHDADYGVILECDVEYPPSLHLAQNSFPLASERVEIMAEDLSPYAKTCWDELKDGAKYPKSVKLTATFRKRKGYVCHGLNALLYLQQGLKITNITRILSFRQAPFIKEYVDFCTKMRAAAPTRSRANVHKLLSVSLYGEHINQCYQIIYYLFFTFVFCFRQIHRECFKTVSGPLHSQP